MKRIDTIDYLRGLMASFIMCYHLLFWSGYKFTSADLFGRIGLYGVSVFYILSGITLYFVYRNRISDVNSVLSFLTKRIFRIFPLLWLITIGTLLILKRHYDLSTIILNLTGAFGFVKPQAGIANGVWSIGNELVFYVFFPLILLVGNRSRSLFLIFNLLLISIGLIIAFHFLDASRPLGEQWSMYVNPFNQALLFCGGILIAHYLKPVNNGRQKLFVRIALALSVLLFILYPANGDVIHLVTGLNRVFLCLICFAVCAFVFVDQYEFPPLIHKIFSFLGETSYSIYLAHALVYGVINGINLRFLHMDFRLVILLSVAGTYLCSYLIYKLIEKPMITIGKKIADKNFSSSLTLNKKI